ERIFGYSRAELLGCPLENFVPERFRAECAELRASFFAGPSPWPMGAGGEFYALRKDRREIPVEVALNLIETEEGPKIFAAIRDITERKQKEETLKAALEERDVLLGEIHRRVKNNLQTMSSLLRLQSANIRDEAALDAFRECEDQIQVIASI